MKKSKLVFAPLFIALAASMVACGSADAGDKTVSASEATSTVASTEGGFSISYDVPGVPAPASKGGFSIAYDVAGYGAP